MNGLPRYTPVAITLHWLIAALIIGNFALGFWMHHAIEEPASRSAAVAGYQVHKSLGLSVLLLSVLRILWRGLHRPPPLPENMPTWQVISARWLHRGFYLLMIVLPLSGWLFVSTQWHGDRPLAVTTLWFGFFEVPHLFGLNQLAETNRASQSALFMAVHETLAWTTLTLFLLHVGAALKHQFIDKDDLLRRMQPSTDAGLGVYILGLVIAIALALAALAGSSLTAPADAKTTGQAISASADGWQIDPSRSHIRFQGEHAGTAFSGVFKRWRADFNLSPEAPENGRITAEIETASASTGLALQESTLREQEWFDAGQYPLARFESTTIIPVEDNRYLVDGFLIIKKQRLAISGFELKLLANRTALFSGKVSISRTQANLGMESDPDGQWVSLTIPVDIAVSLKTAAE